MMPHDRGRDGLTTSQAARVLRVSPSTLKRWAEEGVVRSRRTKGGHRRFQRSDLDEFVSRPFAAGDEARRWADALLGVLRPLQIQSSLYELRLRLESWWDVAVKLTPAIVEMHRRLDAGAITRIELRCGLDRLGRAATWAVETAPHAAHGSRALLAQLPSDRPTATPALLELCMSEDGWRTRWAGPSSSNEIAEELVHHRPQVLVVACPQSTPNDVGRQLGEMARAAEEDGVPIVFVGAGPFAEPASPVAWVTGFAEARSWLARHRPAV